MAQSLTGTLTYTDGVITLSPLARAIGTYATYFLPCEPNQQIFRHHIPGTDGNIVVLGGRMGQVLRIGVMCIGADVADAIGAITDELDDMASSDVAIVICGSTWLRCHLRSCTASKPARPLGGGFAGAEFDFVFDYDN
jgi:hypothetical protein